MALYVGIGGLGSIPVNPWCQRPRRPPHQFEAAGISKGSSMSRAPLSLEVAMLLLGLTGLFAGLARLGSSPFAAVLIIVSATSFLLVPVGGLCGAEVRQILRRRK